jgi:hypothetical protein
LYMMLAEVLGVLGAVITFYLVGKYTKPAY